MFGALSDNKETEAYILSLNPGVYYEHWQSLIEDIIKLDICNMNLFFDDQEFQRLIATRKEYLLSPRVYVILASVYFNNTLLGYIEIHPSHKYKEWYIASFQTNLDFSPIMPLRYISGLICNYLSGMCPEFVWSKSQANNRLSYQFHNRMSFHLMDTSNFNRLYCISGPEFIEKLQSLAKFQLQ